MTWELVLQLSVLGVVAWLLFVTGHGARVDKRREDDIKRKQAGLWK